MNNIKCLGVIPARYASSRLPGKALKDIAGKPMIQRVWERASKAKNIDHLVIATDDIRIADCAEGFGAETVLTHSKHASGSDRVAEVVLKLEEEGSKFDLVANIQGDMPFINPELVDQTVEGLANSEDFGIATVATPIMSEGEFLRTSCVKVVAGKNSEAIYFSRSPIPYWRECDVNDISEDEPYGYKHLGLYVYRKNDLLKLTELEQCLSEKRECLEQLRALHNGINIKIIIATNEILLPSIEVDTPEDLERARAASLGML